jgi:hypothetical protein
MSDAVMHHRGSNQEGEAMSFAIHSPPANRSLDLKVTLIFGVLFPFFLGAALLRRATALLGAGEPAPSSATWRAPCCRASRGIDPERNACRDPFPGRDASAA